MVNNQTNQQQKSDSRSKAIISLVFGIISIFFTTAPRLIDHFFYFPMEFGFILFLFSFVTPFLFGIVGLLFGIMGLKSTKRSFAIAGIVLCGIGLLVPLYYFLFY